MMTKEEEEEKEEQEIEKEKKKSLQQALFILKTESSLQLGFSTQEQFFPHHHPEHGRKHKEL